MNDSANLLSGTTSVAITVNPLTPPAVTVPSLAALVENTSYVFASGAISLSDSSASGSSDSLSLTVTDGKLTLGSTTGISITGGSNGSSSMTVTGTLANSNRCAGRACVRANQRI